MSSCALRAVLAISTASLVVAVTAVAAEARTSADPGHPPRTSPPNFEPPDPSQRLGIAGVGYANRVLKVHVLCGHDGTIAFRRTSPSAFLGSGNFRCYRSGAIMTLTLDRQLVSAANTGFVRISVALNSAGKYYSTTITLSKQRRRQTQSVKTPYSMQRTNGFDRTWRYASARCLRDGDNYHGDIHMGPGGAWVDFGANLYDTVYWRAWVYYWSAKTGFGWQMEQDLAADQWHYYNVLPSGAQGDGSGIVTYGSGGLYVGVGGTSAPGVWPTEQTISKLNPGFWFWPIIEVWTVKTGEQWNTVGWDQIAGETRSGNWCYISE